MIRRTWCAALMMAAAGVIAVSAGPAQALEKFAYGLSWLPEAEHCGFYEARDTGLYRDAGLDVDIVPGGPGVNMPQMLAAGKVDAAMGTGMITLNMRAQGIPGVTIAAMFQKSPQTLVAHPDQGVRTLDDLTHRPISVANFSRQEFWLWLKATRGFDDSMLRPYTYNPSAFVADKTMVQQGYITEDAFFLGKAMGAEPVTLLLADYGYPDYATTIYATEPQIQKRHAVYQAFVDATIRGYAQCLTGDPTPAYQALHAASVEQTPELSAFKVAQMKKYGLVDGGDAARLGIGAMTDARWQALFTVMSGAGAYQKDLDYTKAYTLDFVNHKVEAAQK
jgi:NitT/TauT family transport system substrate-binding protein